MRTKPTILIVFVLVMLLAAACYPPAGPSQLANPATQYCLDNGGHTRPRGQQDDGPSGLCVFPDDSVCDEWAFFRGECGPASQPVDETQPDASTTAEMNAAMPSIDEEVDAFLIARLDETFIPDTSALVEIQTYRDDSPDSEARVVANLQRIRETLEARVETFNAGQETLRLEPFEWQEEIDGVSRWVFGFRLGDGPRKFSILTHMDTVPPGDDDWKPFEPRVEIRDYRGGQQPFLVGRGTVDDKGPGILALSVLEAAAERFDGTDALDGWTLEVSFDTAEETDMNMPYYLDAVGAPELGIVLDAFWCVRAEKGIERPIFSIPLGDSAAGNLWIADLRTPASATNQIPDQATARIEGSDPVALDELAASVEEMYAAYGFDDPEYHRAPLQVARVDAGLVLTTTVEGAQHGSAPGENRTDGANPLVSLANFLAGLVDNGTLASNGYGRMAQFIEWGWGTQVFGEKHPELLKRFDQVFVEGNGTSYALTRLTPSDDGQTLNLAIDIRYALGHHDMPYTGVTPGLLPGKSIFPAVFDELVARYNELAPDAGLTYTTVTPYAPDVTDPSGPQFQTISKGFEEVMGVACPQIATGGGTDAKGFPSLVAAGALFSADLGPPINFHGLSEGAPIDDLHNSALILYHILLQQVSGN